MADPTATAARDLERAAFATVRAAALAVGQNGQTFTAAHGAPIAAKLFGERSGAAAILARAAVGPHTTASLPAAPPVNATLAFLSRLPQSAGAKLIEAGTAVTLKGQASLAVPYAVGQAKALPWVGEGEPIPVADYSLSRAIIGPIRKAGLIAVFTREAARLEGGEEAFTALLRRDAARSLDAALFHAGGATAAAPAGLLYGAASVTASTAGGEAAMQADLAALAATVATAGGHDVVFVLPPALWMLAILRAPDLADRLWQSAALSAGEVVALDPGAFVAAFDPDPEIEAATDAVLHTDTAPADIATGGTVAAPSRSLFQTDTVGLRILYEMDFAMGAPGMVARITGAKW